MSPIQSAVRDEVHSTITENAVSHIVERPLPLIEKIYNITLIRKVAIILALAILWEIGARLINNELLLPTVIDALLALKAAAVSGVIFSRIWVSLEVLLIGYFIGIALAALLTAFSITTRIGTDFLETVTAMLNPVPAIALLPLAMIWFGLGKGAIVFILVHSVLWAVALNTHAGFLSVSQTLRMVGKNYGVTGLRYILLILVPAAFPSILTGMKIAWAFAWRSLIAAELVFGVSSGDGGLGWYIYENKNSLDIPAVYGGLFCVILIGLFIENFIFRNIENHTIRRWGMQNY